MANSFRLLLLLMTLMPLSIRAQDTLVVTLSSLIERSLGQSPEVRATGAKTDFARARYAQARAARFLTEFSATSAHATAPAIDNPNDTPRDRLYLDPEVRNNWEDVSFFNRLEFEAIQPILTWGQLKKSIRAAEAGVLVERAATREKAEEVAARSADLYYSLLLMEAMKRLTTEAGDIVEKARVEIKRLLYEGAEDVDDADLFQVEITEQEFLQRETEVDQRRQTARAALARQMFLPEGQSVALQNNVLRPVNFTLESLEIYQERALKYRPELARAVAGLSARNALIDVARSDYYPKLFIGLSGKFSYAAGRERQRNPYVSDPFLSRGVQAGFGFRQNLNFAQTRAKIEQAEAEAAEVRFLGDAARQLVLFEVEEAFRNVIITRAAVSSREKALAISKDWLRMEQVNFDLEIGDTENLVKAVRDNLALRASRHDAVYKYNLAVIRLLSKSGTLIRDLRSGTLVEL